MNRLLILKVFCFSLFYALSASKVNAQTTFQKSFAGHCNTGYSISSDNNGFLIAGTTCNSGQGGKDILLLRTDLNGNITWAKTIGGIKDETAYALKKTSDGGYIIVGSTSSYVNAPTDGSNFYIVKTDASGNIQWTRAIGSGSTEVAYDVIETYDNNFAIVGTTNSTGLGNTDVYLIELNSSGALQWSYGIGSSGDDIATSLIQASNHDIIIVGSTTGFSAGGQIPYLIKTSEFGVLQNPSYTFNFNSSVVTKKRFFTKIIDGYSNDYAITGSDGTGSIGDAQHFILNINQNMTINWMNKYFLNSGAGVGTSLDKINGGYIIGGTMGIDHPALIRTNSTGQQQATKFFPNLSSTYYGKGYDVRATSDGCAIFVGSRFNTSDTSVYLIKTTANTLISGCDEQSGFFNTETSMTATAVPQTSSYTTITNYIANNQGIAATASPTMSTICISSGLRSNSAFKDNLVIHQANHTVSFLLDATNDQIESVSIYNVYGSLVRSTNSEEQNINTFELSEGVYLYKIITKDHLTYSGKIIVR